MPVGAGELSAHVKSTPVLLMTETVLVFLLTST